MKGARRWAGLGLLIALPGPALAVKLDALLVQDAVRVLAGAPERGTLGLGQLDLGLNLSPGWQREDRLRLSLVANWGGAPSARVGDLQGSSNVETPAQFKPYELWYDWPLAERLSLRAGWQDWNATAYTLPAAQVFLNGSFGIGPELSQIPLPNFPSTAPGLRLHWQPPLEAREQDVFDLQLGVFNGVAGDPRDPSRATLRLSDGDGLFAGVEAGVRRGEARWALGAWLHTRPYTDREGRRRDEFGGLYALGERPLALPLPGRWRGFVLLGQAQADRRDLDAGLSTGLRGSGLLPGRPEDVSGLGLAQARLNGRARPAETTVELTHRFQLAPGVGLQPDLQWVHAPSGRRAPAVWVASLRLILSGTFSPGG